MDDGLGGIDRTPLLRGCEMDRRDFGRMSAALAALSGVATLSGLTAPALAQGALPAAGSFKRIAAPVAQTATGKVEVVEFFWYGCPHCYAFEPKLQAWASKLPPHVQFTRVPVVFRPYEYPNHQKLYYTLELLGKLGDLHAKVFDSIHQQGKRLETTSLPPMALTARSSWTSSARSGSRDCATVRTR